MTYDLNSKYSMNISKVLATSH